MENKYRQFYTENEIMELNLDELEEMSGGAAEANDVKCPVCGKYFPIRTIKEHLRLAHKK